MTLRLLHGFFRQPAEEGRGGVGWDGGGLKVSVARLELASFWRMVLWVWIFVLDLALCLLRWWNGNLVSYHCELLVNRLLEGRDTKTKPRFWDYPFSYTYPNRNCNWRGFRSVSSVLTSPKQCYPQNKDPSHCNRALFDAPVCHLTLDAVVSEHDGSAVSESL